MIYAAVAAVLVLGTAFSCRYAWWRRPVDYRHPRILMYHMVREPITGGRFNKLRVRPREFERQLKWLVKHGWRFAFLSELGALGNASGPSDLAALAAKSDGVVGRLGLGRKAAPRGDGFRGAGKTVILTFDDGYRDNYLNAHPLLAKYGAKATLFLVVDRADRDWSVNKNARHDSGELRDEPKLADSEVRAMLDSGVWELGAHTLTHALLPKLGPAEKRREIAGAKAALETEFGVEASSFAYPFGIYQAPDVAAVADAGYRFGVTTEAGVSVDTDAEALALKRVKVSGKDGRFAFALRLRTGRRGAFD